jgi:hypothetical protein
MVQRYRDEPTVDVTYRKRGIAVLDVSQGVIEVSVELDADRADDLMIALATVAEQQEEYRQELRRSTDGDAERLRRQ